MTEAFQYIQQITQGHHCSINNFQKINKINKYSHPMTYLLALLSFVSIDAKPQHTGGILIGDENLQFEGRI